MAEEPTEKRPNTLIILPGRLAIVRLDPQSALPQFLSRSFLSITRTESELSIVCAEGDAAGFDRLENGWRAMRVAGPIPFTTIGVLASIAVPLAAAGIPIFVVSTHDTDYILVKDERLEEAARALSVANFSVAG